MTMLGINSTNVFVAPQTWGNRADAMVRQAELLAEIDRGQSVGSAVGQAYGQAMDAYDRACSMTSSEQGDDLPGLLHNWGVGLRSMADHQQVLLLITDRDTRAYIALALNCLLFTVQQGSVGCSRHA